EDRSNYEAQVILPPANYWRRSEWRTMPSELHLHSSCFRRRKGWIRGYFEIQIVRNDEDNSGG
ncbi:hypothetical protein PMAYCL1PPCAC_14604, partial [Pristionchus mayeri]